MNLGVSISGAKSADRVSQTENRSTYVVAAARPSGPRTRLLEPMAIVPNFRSASVNIGELVNTGAFGPAGFSRTVVLTLVWFASLALLGCGYAPIQQTPDATDAATRSANDPKDASAAGNTASATTAQVPASTAVSPPVPKVPPAVKSALVRLTAVVDSTLLNPNPDPKFGTGFIVREDGIVATTFTMVAESAGMGAQLTDGTRVGLVGVVATFPAKNLAFLRLEGNGPWPVVPFAESMPEVSTPMTLHGMSPLNKTHSIPTVVNEVYADGGLSLDGQGKRGRWMRGDGLRKVESTGAPFVDDSGLVVGMLAGGTIENIDLMFALSAEDIQESLAEVKNPEAVPFLKALGAAWISGDYVRIPGKREFLHHHEIATEEKPSLKGFELSTPKMQGNGGFRTRWSTMVTLGRPTSRVLVLLNDRDDDPQFQKARTVKLTADGREYEYEAEPIDLANFGEALLVWVLLEDLVVLIRNDSIVIRAGAAEFALTGRQMEAVRDLAARIPPGISDDGAWITVAEEPVPVFDYGTHLHIGIDEFWEFASDRVQGIPPVRSETAVNALPVWEGDVPETPLWVSAVGHPDQLVSITLIQTSTPQSSHEARAFTVYSRFVRRVLPDWKAGGEWVSSLLKSTEADEGRIATFGPTMAQHRGARIVAELTRAEDGTSKLQMTIATEGFAEERAAAQESESEREAAQAVQAIRKLLDDGDIATAKRAAEQFESHFAKTAAARDFKPLAERVRLEDRKVQAQQKFDLAKRLWDSGVKSAGKRRLQELIKEFPETPAADEARELLSKG